MFATMSGASLRRRRAFSAPDRGGEEAAWQRHAATSTLVCKPAGGRRRTRSALPHRDAGWRGRRGARPGLRGGPLHRLIGGRSADFNEVVVTSRMYLVDAQWLTTTSLSSTPGGRLRPLMSSPTVNWLVKVRPCAVRRRSATKLGRGESPRHRPRLSGGSRCSGLAGCGSGRCPARQGSGR